MTLLRAMLPAAALFLCLLTGCETDEAKKPAQLPAQANAPEVSAPAAQPQKPNSPQAAKTQSPTTAAAPAKPSDAVDKLIAQAEKQYAAGQANYQAGHLEAAKANFDLAFNTMLSSDLDVRNDERLQREFDKVVEAVHELEMAALKQGDGFQEQRSEPAPIDEANDITFPVDANVRAKAEAEIKTTKSDLPLVMNDQVAMFINYFSSPRGKATLEHAWERSGRYRAMIEQTLKQEGVPQDLIYLAQAESGFQPLALSRAGARGMWQFMAQSGELHGLQRNWWVDDRQDPEKATRAAGQYLKELYNQFGDWYLAMAAYNSGAGTVQHAVERTGYADFWELYKRGVLPQETRNYVPIIVAVTIIAKNPEQYGLSRVPPQPPPQVDQVTIDYPVDLRLVAECVDTSVDYLQELNPSLLRMTTPKDQPFMLNLPAGSQEKYQTAIALVPPDMRTYWRYHHVDYGDTLPALARKYHTSASSIAEANNLTGEELKAGTKLIIPTSPIRHDTQSAAYSKHPTHYKVRKGDTVASVADDFEVPPDKLRKWNHLRGGELVPGRTLVIYKPLNPDSAEATANDEPRAEHSSAGHAAGDGSTATHTGTKTKTTAAAAQTAKYHKVKKGETLSSIAESNHVSVADLKRENPNLDAKVRPGEVLLIRK